jgi:hypothetical protein
MIGKMAVAGALGGLLVGGVVMAATPFGGDDTGFIPPDKTTAICENAVGKIVGKYVACVLKCHAARANQKLADDTAEDVCETHNGTSGCGDKYDVALANINKKCPGSCTTTNGVGLKGLAEGILDAENGMVYCASPSGAFLN